MNLAIRQADTKDIPNINALANVIFPETYKDILSPEQLDYMMDWMYSPSNLKKQMEEGHVYFI
ncbi:MAG: GNAT family N-acetyltransferase, partial [Bacteroidales bacterium]|nr:GNAT family N-acetyltransferase [Bacteroidales bacterium]